jgi:hypothetical protein
MSFFLSETDCFKQSQLFFIYLNEISFKRPPVFKDHSFWSGGLPRQVLFFYHNINELKKISLGAFF